METIYAKLIVCLLTIYTNIIEKTNFSECQHRVNRLNCVSFLSNSSGDTISFRIASVHPLIGRQLVFTINGALVPKVVTADRCEKALGLKAKRFVNGWLESSSRIDLVDIRRQRRGRSRRRRTAA